MLPLLVQAAQQELSSCRAELLAAAGEVSRNEAGINLNYRCLFDALFDDSLQTEALRLSLQEEQRRFVNLLSMRQFASKHLTAARR